MYRLGASTNNEHDLMWLILFSEYITYTVNKSVVSLAGAART